MGLFFFVFCSADVLVLRRLGKMFCLGVVVVEVWGGCVEQEERESSLSNHKELILTDWFSCVE